MSNLFEPMKDLRARVIYYSSITEPKNILQITKLWDYKTAAYFYQDRSKEIIKEMVLANLILVKGSSYKSNYDLIFKEEMIKNFFKKINNEIENDVIIEKYDYEITETQLSDPLFKEFCLDKKPDLNKILNEIRISDEEAGTFLSLWRTNLFKNIFLSAEIIKKLIDNRKNLPVNPLNLLFDLTLELCESIYFFYEGGERSFPNPSKLWINVNEVLPLLVDKLKSFNIEELSDLKEKFGKVYEIMKNKFAVYEERSEISSYHTVQFSKIMGLKR